jgi:hypothetical protein
MNNEHRKLQKRIEELEKELSELKSQMLALALRPTVVYAHHPGYVQPIYIQPQVPYYHPPNFPIITYNSGSTLTLNSGQHFQ